MIENKVKVCKVCGEEKPIIEFPSKGKGYHDTKCKTCKWFSKRNIDYSQTNWVADEDRLIVDSLLNERYTINEISEHLNKGLKELCLRIIVDLKIGGSTKLPLTVFCANCQTIINIKPHEIVKYTNNFCNKSCADEFQVKNPYKSSTIINKICPLCGREFKVTKHKKRQLYCSKECANKSREDKVVIQCKICGKDIIVKRSMANKVATCSEECAAENRRRICEEKSIKYTVSKICEHCNMDYKVILSESEASRFCSKECYNKWMSENLIGTNNPRFTRQLIKCDYCGNEHYQKLYRINSGMQKHFFCSSNCRQSWFAEHHSQTEEWKESRRIIAVNSLSNGKNTRVDTEPQIILNHLLDDMDIKYINEYNCKYYSVDNYLTEHNLMIECMGTFWHTDNRFYKEINSDIQIKRIRVDKAKKTYVESQYNIPILYIWEYDLINNLDLCEELILEYINNQGNLINYHSFNYFIHDEDLFLSTEVIKPYMEWDSQDLNNITDINIKKKMRVRDESKWMTFECEHCGSLKEQLISKYNKNKHHFCSRSCASNYYYNKRVIDDKGRLIG